MPFFIKHRKLFIWLLISTLIIFAIIIGKNKSQLTKTQLIQQNVAQYGFKIDAVNKNKWISDDNRNIFYLGEGFGYNGNVSIIVYVGADSIIQQVIAANHRETPGYFKKIIKKRFFKQFSGKHISIFHSNHQIDVISGATITSNAIIEAIRDGYLNGENIEITEKKIPLLGVLEIVILYLFISGFALLKIKNARVKSNIRWISILISFVFLGFIYNQPIAYSRLTAFLLGNPPDLFKELYFYILLVGSTLIILITRKNMYCHSVCPFGAAQDILAKTGSTKTFRPSYYKKLKLIQHSIAFSALILALVINNPALAGYEVFSAFFQLTANTFIFGVLVIVIILSLFIKRPWCHYVCPVDSFFGYVKLTREIISGLWKK